ncbi:MAG TPA: TadE/TadG family type IV pilus assembly protein, partial [Anaeromyxobacter sp.]|nr:TadE/TadG family type IV pilus assembly protein [Anaeromyxobacter sp.]
MRAVADRRRHERGAAAVEFALVLPLLLVLLLGAIDWGYFFFLQEVVVNAAREGARAGSVIGDATASDAAAQTRATGYLTSAGLGALGCTVDVPASGVTLTPEAVQVSVSCPAGSVTGFTGVPPLTYLLPATTR